MSRPHISANIALFTLGSILFLTGCGGSKDGGGEAKQAEEGATGASATFKEGAGLILAPEVIRALAITTVEAAEQPLARTLSVTAQVYKSGNGAKAVSLVSPSQADGVKTGLRAVQKGGGQATAQLTAISRIAEKASGQVELVFTFAGNTDLALGDTITLTIGIATETPSLAVPRAAVLQTASGTFVYVVNGTAYLRTPVKTGVSDDKYTEITDGLYEGDVVVVSPVNQLWLSELRLTKGGGHSH